MKIRDRIVDFRRVPARDLWPNPKNWRRHPPQQQDALRGLLAEIGYADALLVRQVDGGLQLLDGHLRAETTPDMDVPVLVLDLDDAEADKLLVTLDPLASMATADVDDLRSLLEQVSTGSDAVQALLDNLAYQVGPPAVNVGLADPDDVPEIPEEATAKRGEVWLCGDHRVMCGDSTKAEDVERLMAGERVEILWTDPPYGVSYVGKTKDALTIANDEGEGVGALLGAVFGNVDGHLEEGAPFYIAHPAGSLALLFGQAVLAVGWHFHQTLVWVKDSMVLGHSDYHYRHEPVLYGWKNGATQPWFSGRAETTVFEVARPKASPDHPIGKPVELIEQHLQNSSRREAVVLDPFLGSGSTMIAAERLGRRCYGMEIEPRYVDVAVRRWEDFTGKTAEREQIGGNKA